MADINSSIAEVIATDEQPVTVTIYKPNGEPYKAADGSECTVSVLGSESKKYLRAKDALDRKAARSQSNGLEPIEWRRRRVSLAFAAMTSWHGWEMNGAPAELDEENAKALMRADHILEQIEKGIKSHADFFDAPSEN